LGHGTAIELLSKKTGCRTATIDQFAAEWVVESALKKKNLDIALTQRTKAEELTVVAAASILARAAFLQGMEMLSEGVGVSLPKGASSRVVDAGVQLIRTLGEQVLPRVCKMHFKTIQQMKERA
jgi:ribonuclease HIII